MFKKIIKMFMPSPKKLSDMAAQKIQTAVNQSGKEDLIAKYAKLADQFTDYQKFVTGILVDGKVDQFEIEEISTRLEPIVAYVISLI